jgi:hypothetical protein
LRTTSAATQSEWIRGEGRDEPHLRRNCFRRSGETSVQIPMKGKKVRVALAFPPDFFDGLTKPAFVMRSGEPLTVEEDPTTQWPAFVLVTSEKGEKGWVPERYLQRKGKKATATRRYDTKTLDPLEGEVLTVIEEDLESGWVWCRDHEGNVGWFAIDHLAPSGE